MAENNTNKQSEYNASQIEVLEGLEAVRKRPGMYIGSTSSVGLHHLVWEIVDNSIDEAMAGFAENIVVEVNEDESITVTDDGRGIPVDIQEKTGRPAVETVLTVLHAGGKFGGGGYKVSGGLHGVGSAVVNALSEWFKVTIYKDGTIYEQEYERGTPKYDLKIVGETDKQGTVITFLADDQIFEEPLTYSFETMNERIQELAFLNKGLNITLIDHRPEEKEERSYHYEGGIKSYARYLTEGENLIYPDPIYFEDEQDDITVEVAMMHSTKHVGTIKSFANNIHTVEGGTHEVGLRTALTRTINDYARSTNFLKDNDENFSGEDVREGLTVVLSVKHTNPQFEGQTKTKLGNSEVRGITDRLFSTNFAKFLLENPTPAKKILQKAKVAYDSRMAAKRARDATRKKSGLEISNLPGKLADSSSKDPEINELFIVEGDSAGGSAKQARNREYQAILPIRGKILNVEKATLDRITANEEIRTMFTALGTGFGENFDASEVRYHKLIIMTDADVDGAHINTLLLTLLYRYMRPMIEEGYVYLAQPPLYSVRQGKKREFIQTDRELETYLAHIPESPKPEIQRYKGLGEMDANELWETTMNPENRTLIRMTIDDAEESNRVIEMLMGDEVPPRREFIEENAQYVDNIDL